MLFAVKAFKAIKFCPPDQLYSVQVGAMVEYLVILQDLPLPLLGLVDGEGLLVFRQLVGRS